MGIWMELGIFIVVLGWGVWQLYDVKQAKAQRVAEEARRAAQAGDEPKQSTEAKAVPTAGPPA